MNKCSTHVCMYLGINKFDYKTCQEMMNEKLSRMINFGWDEIGKGPVQTAQKSNTQSQEFILVNQQKFIARFLMMLSPTFFYDCKLFSNLNRKYIELKLILEF